jgi:S1-C subfamily serine protease
MAPLCNLSQTLLGSKELPMKQIMLKSGLTVALSLACLLMLMAGTSDAKGKGGKGSGGKKFIPPTNYNQKNFGPKYKHKHRSNGDVDVDADGASADAEAAGTEEAEANESDKAAVFGMEITGLFKGTAAKEGLELGDIILEVNGTPTPSYEALAKALAKAGSEAKVLVIREDDDERETVTLFPQNGQIGVAVERVRVDEDEDD